VIKAVSDRQRSQLRRDIDDNPKTDKAEFIEPSIMVPVISRNFDHAFKGVFAKYRQTQSWLTQVVEARNSWAHSRTGDMLADDVAHSLYAMERILAEAGLPEADQVEMLRKDVLGMTPEPTPEPAETMSQAVTPSKSRDGDLPYWWEVCEPHDGFVNPSQVDESRFAATLGGVFAGSAREEYLNPVAFLSQTYFTENLTQMIRDVASRMGGGEGPSVTEVQTPFGGGKTHALLTLYHMITDPKKSLTVDDVQEALGEVKMPTDARVLVFDGQEHGVDPVLKESGVAVHTMWGELASQIDVGLYHRLVQDSDGKGEAPGNAIFRQVLEEASPCLILIDEVVSYLVKLKFSNSRRTVNLYRQTVQFLQETLQLAGNVPGVCMLISLPQSRQEFGGVDPDQLQRELGILDEIQPRADRVVSKRTPVNDDEIYLLMSKRLFKRVDADVAQKVATAYRQIYDKTPGQFEATVQTPDYLEQQIRAYPFHPELIDVLYKKWSTASDFPRTRAVLQMLANIVADQWVNHREAYTIQTAHVDLARERIRTRIVTAAGSGGGYEGVVAADIIGDDAHADFQDQRRGSEYAKHRISRGVATTLLMHSFGGGMRTGAASQDLRLGTVSPNVGPEYVTEVLNTLEESLWYVHREGEFLRFQTRPNIYRVIAQTAGNQPPAVVEDRLKQELEKASGSETGFRLIPWAGTDGVIPDNAEPTIAVLNPRFAVSGSDDNGGVTDRAAIDQVWDRVGGGLRTYRNSLILVAPDRELWDKAEEAVREVLAYESVIGSIGKQSADLSGAEKKELDGRLKDKAESLTTSIATAYKWVLFPEENGLEASALPGPATKGERIAGRVVGRLSDQEYGSPKILKKMGATYFNSKVASNLWKDQSGPLDLGEASRRFPQWTYLPILPDREATLKSCIQEGLIQKLWAVAIGDNATSTYQTLIESADGLDQLTTLFDGSASLVKGDLLDLIREQVAPLKKPVGGETEEPEPSNDPPKKISDGPGPGIPAPPKRLTKVRLRMANVPITKTTNLQPYLFKVLQDEDAGVELDITINVTSDAGISDEVLEKRIVEGFDQLGVSVEWEEG
jgi:hypothetical protein